MAKSTSFTLGTAAACFTFTGNPSASDTVTIGDQVYTFEATPSSAYDVDIGANQDASLTNLAAAINDSGTEGTDYGTGTVANPYFSATADTANNELDLTARFAGSWCNGIHLAESSTAITVAAANFAGVSGGTDGAGLIHTFLDDLYGSTAINQVNSEVMQYIAEITAAAD